MDKIKIAITGRVASVVALPEVVADNAEYEVDFALDPREGWDVTLPITALFVRRDGSYTPRILDAGKTSCTMPPQTGTNIVFVGLTQDDMRTTTPATIKVQRSIRTVAHDPLPAPSEDVYAQILAAYAGIKTISGKGAPTSATQGKVNQLYRDEDTQRLYICTATGGGYTWAAVSGGSVDVDATLTKAGYAADAKAAGDAIGEKLDKTALPTAINDALAQAKASGEFDGEKGETGPAGAKGDTGPAGPKGADGKDGAGMDVTGAKVGQIAKITAVDTTGKPTEWEPVDMPGGGGTITWTLLQDVITTEEDVTEIAISPENMSQHNAYILEYAFNANKAYSFGVYANDAASAAWNLVRLKYGNYLFRKGQIEILPVDGPTNIKMQVRGYTIEKGGAEQNINLETGGDIHPSTNDSNLNYIIVDKVYTPRPPFNRLAINSFNQEVKIMAGAKIRLWGANI